MVLLTFVFLVGKSIQVEITIRDNIIVLSRTISSLFFLDDFKLYRTARTSWHTSLNYVSLNFLQGITSHADECVLQAPHTNRFVTGQ